MKIFFTLLLIFTLITCTQTSKEKINEIKAFNISGTIKGEYSDFIYLNYGKTKDSTKIEKNSFKFSGSVEKPIQGYLSSKLSTNPAWMYIENSVIEVDVGFKEVFQNDKPRNILEINYITGSYSAKIQKEYKEFYQKNQSKENFKKLLYEKLKIFLKKNSQHPFSGNVIGELALTEPILTKNELTELYSKIDTTKQNRGDLEMYKMGIAHLDKYGIGKPFLKFKLPNMQDEEVDITSYLRKITLVDFWASWCGPCRAKHPDLIELKEMFKNKKFDILSISIDESKEHWIRAIEKDKLTWTNVWDGNKKISNELGIQDIPFNYLIDEKGFVLGVNLPIKQIERILNEKASR